MRDRLVSLFFFGEAHFYFFLERLIGFLEREASLSRSACSKRTHSRVREASLSRSDNRSLLL